MGYESQNDILTTSFSGLIVMFTNHFGLESKTAHKYKDTWIILAYFFKIYRRLKRLEEKRTHGCLCDIIVGIDCLSFTIL